MPLSELYDLGRGYIVDDTCVVEVDFPGFRSVELKTASAEGETPESTSRGDIDGNTRQTASGTDTIPPQTDILGPPPASKSATETIKALVIPTTPIVEKESKEVELPRSTPTSAPPESSSFDDMNAYISELVSAVETDAIFDSTTEGSVTTSIPQSTIDEAKKFFIEMLSRDLSEIPYLAARLTKSIRVLSECCDLTPAQLAELNTFKVEFPTLLQTYQTSNHSLKEVEEKMAEKQGTKKSLVEQIKIDALAFQMQWAIHTDFISKAASLQAELTKISEKKRSAEKEMKQLHEDG
ncbi:uncharacterized protein LOC132311741 isoform X2 [Cornus florida]|uniref:uncharacterized protein LOC132311741 isoform X2 n=1 Tax=Cornus florida TaxID=4283 RepID=UPI00289B98B2|nr:uncharacterized protein LOC132311741 isoform X2 [Cornus florida]